jgi:hypothetical protein
MSAILDALLTIFVSFGCFAVFTVLGCAVLYGIGKLIDSIQEGIPMQFLFNTLMKLKLYSFAFWLSHLIFYVNAQTAQEWQMMIQAEEHYAEHPEDLHSVFWGYDEYLQDAILAEDALIEAGAIDYDADYAPGHYPQDIDSINKGYGGEY